MFDILPCHAKYTNDQPGLVVAGEHTNCIDVDENYAVYFAKSKIGFPTFPRDFCKGRYDRFEQAVEFHRDMLRAKLVSIKVPRRLIEFYIQVEKFSEI